MKWFKEYISSLKKELANVGIIPTAYNPAPPQSLESLMKRIDLGEDLSKDIQREKDAYHTNIPGEIEL